MTNYDFVARGSAWIQRAPENGKDGVGITSADVVFAQSKSSTNPPADTDVWKTNVKELSLVDGYLWSGTKIVYSNKDIAITGKYCIGSTRDFTDIEELYYLSDSGDKIPTNVTFQSSFKPEKGKYLWTCIRYRFKAPSGSAENTNWVYSTPTCAGYFGDDGVSVQSSDVVFAIGESRTTAPATGWITNFVGLTLAEGKYVWTCTKTTLTDGDSYYTGAYCLGECYDFAQVEELYALSDSSTNPPDDEFFSSSYKVVKGKYLWSCVKVTYNDANISYLNRTCVNYFPNDGVNGTKFTPKGTAYGHYTASSKMPKPSDDVLGLLYLVDKVDTALKPINSPCVAWWRSISAGSYILAYDAAEEGDAYNVDGTLWVHNGTVWKDFGSIQGPKGDDGEDALNIDLSTDRLIFGYNSPNFNPSSGSVAIVARHGNTVIDPSEYSVKITSTQNYDAKKASISTSGKSYNLIFKADGIAMITYSPTQAIEGSENIKYPVSSCNIKLAISYNGITYTKTIFMDVSFAQTYGDLKWNTERLYGEFGEFKTDVAGKFTQTASAISLKADAATLSNFKNEYDENGKVVNKRIGEIEVNYKDINISVGNINDGLKRTGINITDGSITMTANKFKLYNNNKEEVFSADENGNGVFKGNITATGGSFGSFQITSYTDGSKFKFYGMSAKTEGTTMIASSTFTVDYNGLYIGSGLQDNGGSVWIGNNSRKTGKDFSWDDGVIKVDANNSGVSNAEISGIGVNVVGNTSHSAIGMKVSATGGKNNYAVYAENGDFRAENGAFIGVHRGNVKKTGNSNYTLKKTDSTIVCNNTAKDISITLPSDALAGTFYRIIKRGKTVTFQSSKKDISLVNNIDLLSSVSSGTAREWINCLWDGECWLMEMSRS